MFTVVVHTVHFVCGRSVKEFHLFSSAFKQRIDPFQTCICWQNSCELTCSQTALFNSKSIFKKIESHSLETFVLKNEAIDPCFQYLMLCCSIVHVDTLCHSALRTVTSCHYYKKKKKNTVKNKIKRECDILNSKTSLV